jgi:hypothetical protein
MRIQAESNLSALVLAIIGLIHATTAHAVD